MPSVASSLSWSAVAAEDELDVDDDGCDEDKEIGEAIEDEVAVAGVTRTDTDRASSTGFCSESTRTRKPTRSDHSRSAVAAVLLLLLLSRETDDVFNEDDDDDGDDDEGNEASFELVATTTAAFVPLVLTAAAVAKAGLMRTVPSGAVDMGHATHTRGVHAAFGEAGAGRCSGRCCCCCCC